MGFCVSPHWDPILRTETTPKWRRHRGTSHGIAPRWSSLNRRVALGTPPAARCSCQWHWPPGGWIGRLGGDMLKGGTPGGDHNVFFSARPLGSLENGVANLIRSHLAHDFSSLVAWLLYFFHPLAPTWNFSGSTERCWFGSVLWERSLETPPWKRAVFWNGSFRPWKKREKTTGQLKKNQHPGDYFIKKFRRWLFSQLCWKSKY